jgi:hypothetical protein
MGALTDEQEATKRLRIELAGEYADKLSLMSCETAGFLTDREGRLLRWNEVYSEGEEHYRRQTFIRQVGFISSRAMPRYCLTPGGCPLTWDEVLDEKRERDGLG